MILATSLTGSTQAASQPAKASGSSTVQRRDLVGPTPVGHAQLRRSADGVQPHQRHRHVAAARSGDRGRRDSVPRRRRAGGPVRRSVPAYRDLSASDTAGRNVGELTQNLKALGFDPRSTRSPSTTRSTRRPRRRGALAAVGRRDRDRDDRWARSCSCRVRSGSPPWMRSSDRRWLRRIRRRGSDAPPRRRRRRRRRRVRGPDDVVRRRLGRLVVQAGLVRRSEAADVPPTRAPASRAEPDQRQPEQRQDPGVQAGSGSGSGSGNGAEPTRASRPGDAAALLALLKAETSLQSSTPTRRRLVLGSTSGGRAGDNHGPGRKRPWRRWRLRAGRFRERRHRRISLRVPAAVSPGARAVRAAQEARAAPEARRRPRRRERCEPCERERQRSCRRPRRSWS